MADLERQIRSMIKDPTVEDPKSLYGTLKACGMDCGSWETGPKRIQMILNKIAIEQHPTD